MSEQIYNYVSWETLILIKHIIIILFTAFLTFFTLLFILGKIICRVKRVDTLEDIIVVKWGDNKEPQYLINPKTTKEGIMTILSILYLFLFRKKHFVFKDTKFINILLIFLFIFTIICGLLLGYFIFNVNFPPNI